jgi:hypothetical protein
MTWSHQAANFKFADASGALMYLKEPEALWRWRYDRANRVELSLRARRRQRSRSMNSGLVTARAVEIKDDGRVGHVILCMHSAQPWPVSADAEQGLL